MKSKTKALKRETKGEPKKLKELEKSGELPKEKVSLQYDVSISSPSPTLGSTGRNGVVG